MKKYIVPVLFLVSFVVMGWAFSPNARAGTITGNGYYWSDVYNYLSNILTMANEEKADHNVILGSYSTTRVMVNEMKTDHNNVMAVMSSVRSDYSGLRTKYNNLFVKYSTLNYQAGRTGGFASYTGTQKVIVGSQRVTGTLDATVISASRTTSSSDSAVVTGARTTTTDLTLTNP